MGYCKKCGWELNTGANFCPNCGEPTSESSVARQEVKAAIKSQARKTSTAGNTKVAHKRKKKAPIRYGTWEKVALVIGGCLLIVSLFNIGMDSLLIFGVNILGCLSMLYAIVTILLRKSEITNQGAQVLAIVSLLFFPVMKGMEYLAIEDNKNKIEYFSDFSDVLPDDGSRLFIAENTKPYGMKNITIKRIVLYEKNDERDFELEGITDKGYKFTEKGGWFADKKETYQAQEYKYTHLCAGSIFKECHHYFVDYSGNVYFCTGLTVSGEDVAKAFSKVPIAKLRVATDEEIEAWQQDQANGDNKTAVTIKPQTSEEKEYAENGFKDGAAFGSVGDMTGGFGGAIDIAKTVGVLDDEIDVAIRNAASRDYEEKYGNTTSSKQERLKEIYTQHYIDGFRSKMNTSND